VGPLVDRCPDNVGGIKRGPREDDTNGMEREFSDLVAALVEAVETSA